MRLIWHFHDPSGDPLGTESVLATLRQRFRFLQPPQQRARDASCYQAVPWTRRGGRRALEFLLEQPSIRRAVLELAVLTPDTPIEPLGGAEPSLAWKPAKVLGQSQSYDWRRHQRYLMDASVGGIDAHYAWGFVGGRGENIRLTDVERGCDTQHEDLRVTLGHLNIPAHNHGTQTLGVCAGDPDNAFGIAGVCHRAEFSLQPIEKHWLLVRGYELVADQIHQAVENLRAGDVLLLEVEGKFDTAPGPRIDFRSALPIELSPDVRHEIDKACEKGVYVVEPAGNGDHDLDRIPELTENRSHAIMVGAGHPISRGRLRGTNFGARVDLQGWGTGVVTTGLPRTLQAHRDKRRCYTQSFNGTSSAAAIVAGAVACLSGIVKANGRDPLSPAKMRGLLRTTGQRQADGGLREIGPLPNLRAAIRKLEKEGTLERR